MYFVLDMPCRARGIYIISKPTARKVISNLPRGKYIELRAAKHIDKFKYLQRKGTEKLISLSLVVKIYKLCKININVGKILACTYNESFALLWIVRDEDFEILPVFKTG